jgi:hypothetical protein
MFDTDDQPAAVRAMARELADGEGEIRRLSARRHELISGIAGALRAAYADEDAALTERAIAMEVAGALGVSLTSAGLLIIDSDTLTERLPHTLAALGGGSIGAYAARQIASAVRHVRDETAVALDEPLALEAAQLLPGQVKPAAEARVDAVDPGAAARRARSARSDRRVWYQAMSNSVAGIGAVVPAEQAAACWHALDDHARSCRAGGDDRTIDQIKADTLVERVTGAARAEQAAQIELQVVITDRSLLGADPASVDLAGFGGVPAGLLGELSEDSRAWVRRLLTDPIDASASTVDTGRRRFDGALRRLITVRDRRCRHPYCNAPVRDVDHRVPWADGGETTADNGDGYCRRCHRLKDHPAITVVRRKAVDGSDAHRIVWTAPSGAEHPALAPPALGHGSPSPDQLRRRQRLLARAASTPDP